MRKDHKGAGILPNHLHGVWNFAVIRDRILASGREDGLRRVLTQCPLNHIQVVGAKIGELPTGVIPKPAEFIQAAIRIERNLGRGAKPKIPIQTGRRVAVGRVADSLWRLIAKVIALGHGNLADGAVANLPDCFMNKRTRAPMQADLRDSARLLSDCDHFLSFRNCQTQGFLHVNILPRSTRGHKLKGMPMIGSGNHHCVQILLLDQLSEIMVERRLATNFLLSRIQIRLIHVAQSGNFTIFMHEKSIQKLISAIPHSDHAQAHPVVAVQRHQAGGRQSG